MFQSINGLRRHRLLPGINVTGCRDVVQHNCPSVTLICSLSTFWSSGESRRDRLFIKLNNRANQSWDCQSVPMPVIR